MPEAGRIYWDACAWIAYIQREMPGPTSTFTEARYEKCLETLQRAERGEVEIATSAFTLAEVCKKNLDPTSPASHLPSFFDKPYILLIPVDKQVGLRAQNLQVAGVGKLKPPDAVHLASALIWSVPIFQTFDTGLLALNGVLTTANGNMLQIMRPTDEMPKPGLLEAMGG